MGTLKLITRIAGAVYIYIVSSHVTDSKINPFPLFLCQHSFFFHCGTNTLHVAPTLCMCAHTSSHVCKMYFLWPTVFSVSTRLESVVRKQRQQQLDLSAILNQSAVSWEVVAPLFLVWGL